VANRIIRFALECAHNDRLPTVSSDSVALRMKPGQPAVNGWSLQSSSSDNAVDGRKRWTATVDGDLGEHLFACCRQGRFHFVAVHRVHLDRRREPP
jgi:hypothetical protein